MLNRQALSRAIRCRAELGEHPRVTAAAGELVQSDFVLRLNTWARLMS